MKWDKAAAALFTGLLIAESGLEGARLHAEAFARRAGRDRVKREDVEKVSKLHYGRITEKVRVAEMRKRLGLTEPELRRRISTAARDVLARDVELFVINTCRAEPSDRNIDPQALKPELERKLRDLNVTAVMADKLGLKRPVSTHHRFVVAVAGCAAGCSTPEGRNFGIAGVVRPQVTDAKCTECYACVDACRQHAIVIRRGRPEIANAVCDFCGRCTKVCPSGSIAAAEKGYRVFVGGRLGRFHQPGFVLFRLTDKQTMMNALGAVIGLIHDEAQGEENLSELMKRLGPAPLYQRIFQQRR